MVYVTVAVGYDLASDLGTKTTIPPPFTTFVMIVLIVVEIVVTFILTWFFHVFIIPTFHPEWGV